MTKNFLSSLNFNFSLHRAPNIEYFIQSANIPEISIGSAKYPTPFVNIPLPGDKIQFSPLQITFKVDEALDNYLEIFNWMSGLGKPESFTQYKQLADNPPYTGNGIVSDCTLTILNSHKNKIKDVVFKNSFPTTLSGLIFNTTDTDITYITASATFLYQSFTLS